MRYRRKPTATQRDMIVLLAIAFAALFVFLGPEIAGIVSPDSEDTFSEWVWDLPLAIVIVVSVLFAVTALIMAWAAIHFVEGHISRRRKEAPLLQIGGWDEVEECPRCEGTGFEPDLRAPPGEAGECGLCVGTGIAP